MYVLEEGLQVKINASWAIECWAWQQQSGILGRKLHAVNDWLDWSHVEWEKLGS